jgi:hypothetical protein
MLLSIFDPTKNQKKNKIKKYKRIHMRKASKIAQIGGEGSK